MGNIAIGRWKEYVKNLEGMLQKSVITLTPQQ